VERQGDSSRNHGPASSADRGEHRVLAGKFGHRIQDCPGHLPHETVVDIDGGRQDRAQAKGRDVIQRPDL
jgi:hypothetical protein